MIKRFIYYITVGIWNKPEQEYKSSRARWAARQIKALIFTAKGIKEHDIVVRSSALTFYTLMSIVPIAALVFGVVKGFGLEHNFEKDLVETFPQYTILIQNIIEFANNLLLKTKGGLIASVGFVVLLWAVMRVFGNVERAFNHIWEVKKQRPISRKFSDYITVVFVAPILWIISNSLSVLIKNELNTFSVHFHIEMLYWLGSLVSIWLMFGFVYFVMPNTKVKFKGACMAAIIAGTVFQLFQVGYIYVQTQMNSYNAIYGSFAALPLFLICMQASWQILLFGAELSFAYQNISKYEQEMEVGHINYDHRVKITVAVMCCVVRRFSQNSGGSASETVAEELNLPVRIVRDVIFDLERAKLLLPVVNDINNRIVLYAPARDIHAITVCAVIDGVENLGEANFQLAHTPQMDKVDKILSELKGDMANSPRNLKITDLM